MLRKSPPATIVPGPEASASTVAFAFGFHAVAAPVVRSRAAIRLRVRPPIEVKNPPA